MYSMVCYGNSLRCVKISFSRRWKNFECVWVLGLFKNAKWVSTFSENQLIFESLVLVCVHLLMLKWCRVERVSRINLMCEVNWWNLPQHGHYRSKFFLDPSILQCSTHQLIIARFKFSGLTCIQVCVSTSSIHASSHMMRSRFLPQSSSTFCLRTGPQPHSLCPTISGSIRGVSVAKVRPIGQGWLGLEHLIGPVNDWLVI